jgi:hypothetical protein
MYRVRRTLHSFRKSNPNTSVVLSTTFRFFAFRLMEEIRRCNKKRAECNTAWRLFTETSNANQFIRILIRSLVRLLLIVLVIFWVFQNMTPPTTIPWLYPRRLKSKGLLMRFHSSIRKDAHDQPSILIHRRPHVVGPRHPGPTFGLSLDGRSRCGMVCWSYTTHSHHIHTSVPNICMCEYR